jgi:hypothetical protein
VCAIPVPILIMNEERGDGGQFVRPPNLDSLLGRVMCLALAAFTPIERDSDHLLTGGRVDSRLIMVTAKD